MGRHASGNSVFIHAGIDGYYTDLRAKTGGNFVDEFRTTDSCTVDAYLVGSGIKQSLYVF